MREGMMERTIERVLTEGGVVEKSYEQAVRPLLLKITGNDPEPLHDAFVFFLRLASEWKGLAEAIENVSTFRDRALEQRICGLDFRNITGVACGFNKNVRLTPAVTMLGVGFDEIGTVTPPPQKGSPRPRIEYLIEDRAFRNWMRLPNDGMEVVAGRLEKAGPISVPVIVSIGMGINTPLECAVREYLLGLRRFYICDNANIVSVNASCPHMDDFSKLREKEYFRELISALKLESKELSKETGLPEKPIFMKLSPDDDEVKLDELLGICLDYGVDGIIVVNTTLSRQRLKIRTGSEGGISGEPLFPEAVARVKHTSDYCREHSSREMPIIGAGGVFSAKDAYKMLKAGAWLIQSYTGFVYNIWRFFWFFRQINKGVLKMMERDGFRHISEIRKLGSESSERKLE